jgi:hypothetical protein
VEVANVDVESMSSLWLQLAVRRVSPKQSVRISFRSNPFQSFLNSNNRSHYHLLSLYRVIQ